MAEAAAGADGTEPGKAAAAADGKDGTIGCATLSSSGKLAKMQRGTRGAWLTCVDRNGGPLRPESRARPAACVLCAPPALEGPQRRKAKGVAMDQPLTVERAREPEQRCAIECPAVRRAAVVV